MSQKTEPKFLIIGAVSSIAIACLCGRALVLPGIKSGSRCSFISGSPVKKLSYLIWLLVQIIKSALYVSKLALSDGAAVDPSVVYFRADYDSPFARAMLANSITLTPGTITIDITEDGIYSVHALTEELREGLLDGSMQQKVAEAFGEEIGFRALSESEIPDRIKPADEHRSALSFRARRAPGRSGR